MTPEEDIRKPCAVREVQEIGAFALDLPVRWAMAQISARVLGCGRIGRRLGSDENRRLLHAFFSKKTRPQRLSEGAQQNRFKGSK